MEGPHMYGFEFAGKDPLESVDPPSRDVVVTCSPPPLTDLSDTPEPEGTGEDVIPRPSTPLCEPVPRVESGPAELAGVIGVPAPTSGLAG